MALTDLLGGGNYLAINRKIIKYLGPAAAIMYIELVDKSSFYEELEQLDKEGMFYQTVESVEESIGLGRSQQSEAIKKLVDNGLIIYIRKGLPAKRYFKIVEEPPILKELLLKNTRKSRDVENAENLQTRLAENYKQDYRKPANKFAENLPETNLDITNLNIINQNNNVVEIFKKNGINDIENGIKRNPGLLPLLLTFSTKELEKIGETLRKKEEEGKIRNPIGLLVSGSEKICKAILEDSFYPGEKPKKQHSGEEYEIFLLP